MITKGIPMMFKLNYLTAKITASTSWSVVEYRLSMGWRVWDAKATGMRVEGFTSSVSTVTILN